MRLIQTAILAAALAAGAGTALAQESGAGERNTQWWGSDSQALRVPGPRGPVVTGPIYGGAYYSAPGYAWPGYYNYNYGPSFGVTIE
jgi:hypothetical protein